MSTYMQWAIHTCVQTEPLLHANYTVQTEPFLPLCNTMSHSLMINNEPFMHAN